MGQNDPSTPSSWRRVSLILLGGSLIAYRATKDPLVDPARLMSTTSSLIADFMHYSHPPEFTTANISWPICTEPTGGQCRVFNGPVPISIFNETDPYTCNDKCSAHATCYFGTCLCHPGYEGPRCQIKMITANPWYTADCPNLRDENTLDVNRTDLGGVKFCQDGLAEHVSLDTGISYCSYLCYSNLAYGSAIVPHVMWERAQEFQDHRMLQYMDHFQGFGQYQCVPKKLGNVLEFGAGPWTQFRGLLNQRPDAKVNSYTVLDPKANLYMEKNDRCAYKTGKLAKFPDASNFHEFPVFVKSSLGGECKPSTT